MDETTPSWAHEAYYLQDRVEALRDRPSWRRTPLVTRRALAYAFWCPLFALFALSLPMMIARGFSVRDALSIGFTVDLGAFAMLVFIFVTCPILLVRAAGASARDWFRRRG